MDKYKRKTCDIINGRVQLDIAITQCPVLGSHKYSVIQVIKALGN